MELLDSDRARTPGGASAARVLRRAGESALVAVATVALLLATAWRAADPATGADVGAALAATSAELPVTLPAAVLVLGAFALNVAAGASLLRLVRGSAYRTWSQAALAGVAGGVVLDVALVSLLGGLGWFRVLPVLTLLILATVAGATRRPLVAQPLRIGRPRPWHALLVLVAWSSVVLVSLASPVVPAADVLPNHVAPAEHLRAFGSIASLATYPSPIYGPSRLFLGYEALMATLAVLSGLPASLAVAVSTAWLVPVTALAARHLAARAFGRGAAFWALIAMLPTFTFVRLVDVRDSVVSLPIAAIALSCVVGSRIARQRERPPAGQPDWVLTAALTAAVLVHPLVGTLTGLALLLATLARPGRHLRRAVPALAATGVAALPQLAVMTGSAPAPLAALAALAGGAVAAVLVARALDGLARRLADRRSRASARPRAVAGAGAAVAGLLVLLVIGTPAAGQAAGWLNLAFPLLFAAGAAALAGFAPTGRGGRSLVAAGVAAGLLLLLAAARTPEDTLLGQSIRYEVPKAVGYWLPWACAPALAGLAAAAARRARRRGGAWLAVPAGVLAVALLPLGPVAPNAAQASHPAADVTVSNLRTAQHGYWQGYPDARLLTGASGSAVDSFLMAQIRAGRLLATDRLLHVAASDAAWDSVPVADLTGVDETTVSEDASQTIFTAGGRVHPLADLPALLGDGFGWVLLEPTGLPASARSAIVAAGYRPVFSTAGAEVFAAAGVIARG